MKHKTISEEIKTRVASRRQFLVETKHEQNVCLEEAKKLKVKVITSKDNQHKIYDVVPCYRSKCCGAPVQNGNGTKGYVCSKCGNSCRVV